MSEWFGIRGYIMKNAVMDYASFFEAKMTVAREIAGHSKESLNVTKTYTKASIYGAIRKMAESIQIPNLKFSPRSED